VGNALGVLAHEVPLFPNALNANNNNAALQAINAALINIQNTVNGLQNTVNGLQNAVNGLVNELALQPMRITNASASNNAELVYPPGTAAGVLPQLPRTKNDAILITGVRAVHALGLLGVQALQGANAEQLRAQFCQFLGV